MILRAARADDILQIVTLLSKDDLPTDIEDHLDDFIVAENDGLVIGAIGLEQDGTSGLLRSLVVAESARGQRLGHRLCNRLFERAAQLRLSQLYLLTTTARDFFLKLGFQQTERADVPEFIAQTREFRELCPGNADCLCRRVESARG